MNMEARMNETAAEIHEDVDCSWCAEAVMGGEMITVSSNGTMHSDCAAEHDETNH